MLDVYIFYKKKFLSKLFCHDAKKNYDIYSTYNILKGNNDYTLSQNLHTCTEAGGFFFQPRVNLDILLAKWLSNICTCN